VDPGHVKGLRAVNTREEFEACLREAPPVNRFLAARSPDGMETPTPGQEVPEWGVG
jgi:hypothetical protein